MNYEREESLPLEVQYENKQKLELEGGDVEFIELDPDSKKTEVPVLFCPGWVTTSEVVKDNLLEFANQGRRTICVDATHGIDTEGGTMSEEMIKDLPKAELRKVAALIQSMEEKGIDQVDAVAMSEGGIYLTIAATLYPEKFRNIVLVDPGGMSGDDDFKELAGRFSKDWFYEKLKGLLDPKVIRKIIKKDLVGGKNLASNISQSIKEVEAVSNTQIPELLKDLKSVGKGISIIHGVDDKAFPMERIQEMTNTDQVDGFYSVKGSHNQFVLEPGVYTRLADQALDALEKKYSN
jgi:pimeloyl-ACP methyl ester carboxylesterase